MASKYLHLALEHGVLANFGTATRAKKQVVVKPTA
jgi:hypothetical protein